MARCLPWEPAPLLHWDRSDRIESLSPRFCLASRCSVVQRLKKAPHFLFLLNDVPGVQHLSVWAAVNRRLTDKWLSTNDSAHEVILHKGPWNLTGLKEVAYQTHKGRAMQTNNYTPHIQAMAFPGAACVTIRGVLIPASALRGSDALRRLGGRPVGSNIWPGPRPTA